MSEQKFDYRDEKQEEKDEKERDKQEEKTVEEKWQRDPLGTIAWAAILIWAGLVFLADNLNMLANIPVPTGLPADWGFVKPGVWSLIFIGAGVIILIEVVIRLVVPSYRRPVGGNVILALVFLGIGLGNIFNWQIVWPIILIALGLSIILRRSFRRRL
jgi:hypothetical protein